MTSSFSALIVSALADSTSGTLERTGGRTTSDPHPAPDAANKPPAAWYDLPADELADRLGATPVRSIEDLRGRFSADLWDSDDEVEEFIAFARELRNSDLT